MNGLDKVIEHLNHAHFSVALVVRGEKSPQLRAFSRQPARQRDSNGVGNRL